MGSGFAALRGGARLAAYIDLKSPYAYLAIEPTRDVARALGVDIDWRPFTLDIPSYLGSAKLSKGSKKVEKSERSPTQWSGVKYAYMDARRYANLTGRTVRGTVKIWDSSQAGVMFLWAKRFGAPALDRVIDHAEGCAVLVAARGVTGVELADDAGAGRGDSAELDQRRPADQPRHVGGDAHHGPKRSFLFGAG